jgi:alpha-L-fucosidase
LIHLLVDIVSKGGNLLLNIGPQPNGELPPTALSRLKDIGDWMAINAEAIHGTRPIPPYKEGRIAFTKKGDTIYAIYLAEDDKLSEKISLPELNLSRNFKVSLLGFDGAVKWSVGDNIDIDIPESVIQSPPCHYAFVFKLAKE